MNEPVSRVMRFLKMLKDDPAAVHMAMLRGSIARPDRMESMEKALRHYAKGPDGEIARKALQDLTEPSLMSIKD